MGLIDDTAGRKALRLFCARLKSRSFLGEAERAILQTPHEMKSFKTNHDIVTPKQRVDHSCLIAEGFAARYDDLGGGSRQINAIYLPGDMADLHSVVAPSAEWGIVALTRTTVAEVPHTALQDLADNDPRIARAFWRDGTADASILARWVGNSRRKSEKRLAHLLCEIGVRLELAGLGRRDDFNFPTSQHQLGDAIGISGVHLNRTLQALRSTGAIRTEAGRFITEDWKRLRSIAQFDEGYLLIGSGHPRA